MRENSPLRRLIKMAAEEMADPGLQAMADAGDIAKGPAGMPGIKMHPEKADGKDESKDVMRVAHELDAKTKEIAGLRQQLQEAKMDAQRVQVKAEITNEQTKMREGLRQEQQRMLEGLRREQERMYAQIRAEQKELDKKQSELQIAEARQKGEITAAKAEYEAGHTAAQAQYEAQFTAAEAQNRANMAIAQAQHQAQLDKDVSAHDAQIAQSKADSLMDIAQQTTDMYIKQTEKARADADKYFSTQQQQYSASHPVISPALQSRLDGAMQSVGRVGKALNSMTSMSKLGRAMRDLEKVASAAYTNLGNWAEAAKVTPTLWNSLDTAYSDFYNQGRDYKLPLTPEIRKALFMSLTPEQRAFILANTVAEEEFRPIVKGMDVNKPYYGDISLEDRARAVAIMLDRRQNYVTRALMEDGLTFAKDHPFAAFYNSVDKAEASVIAKRMGKYIEDYRAAARSYMDKLKEDIYVNPEALDDKTRLDKLDELNNYYDIVSRVEPNGQIRRDDPFKAGRYHYSLGKYGTYRSAWNQLANVSEFYRRKAAQTTWDNVMDYLDPIKHWYNNTNAGILVHDFYHRRVNGIPGVNGGRNRGYLLSVDLPLIGEHPRVPFDLNPLNWFREGEYPDIGATPEETEYNRKVQDRCNKLFGSYTAFGANVDAGADMFWDLNSVYIPGVAASLVGKVGKGVQGARALAQAGTSGNILPAVKKILPHTIGEGVRMGAKGGITALDAAWMHHLYNSSQWDSSEINSGGDFTNTPASHMQRGHSYYYTTPVMWDTINNKGIENDIGRQVGAF